MLFLRNDISNPVVLTLTCGNPRGDPSDSTRLFVSNATTRRVEQHRKPTVNLTRYGLPTVTFQTSDGQRIFKFEHAAGVQDFTEPSAKQKQTGLPRMQDKAGQMR